MTPIIGETRLFAGKYAPQGWATCEGQTLQIANYEALYSLIGPTYGGDGQTTFALPDLRGRVPVSQGHGPGLNPRRLGEQFGTETVALTTDQLPAHGHHLQATTKKADGAKPEDRLFAQSEEDPIYAPAPADPPSPASLSPDSVTNTGKGAPHDNMMPSMPLRFIIALEGVYPSRN